VPRFCPIVQCDCTEAARTGIERVAPEALAAVPTGVLSSEVFFDAPLLPSPSPQATPRRAGVVLKAPKATSKSHRRYEAEKPERQSDETEMRHGKWVRQHDKVAEKEYEKAAKTGKSISASEAAPPKTEAAGGALRSQGTPKQMSLRDSIKVKTVKDSLRGVPVQDEGSDTKKHAKRKELRVRGEPKSTAPETDPETAHGRRTLCAESPCLPFCPLHPGCSMLGKLDTLPDFVNQTNATGENDGPDDVDNAEPSTTKGNTYHARSRSALRRKGKATDKEQKEHQATDRGRKKTEATNKGWKKHQATDQAIDMRREEHPATDVRRKLHQATTGKGRKGHQATDKGRTEHQATDKGRKKHQTTDERRNAHRATTDKGREEHLAWKEAQERKKLDELSEELCEDDPCAIGCPKSAVCGLTGNSFIDGNVLSKMPTDAV